MNGEYSRQLWGVLSPLLASVFWFEHVDGRGPTEAEDAVCETPSSSSSTASSTPSLVSSGTRRLVLHYETCKSQTLEQYNQYKHYKWGEHEFCEFDLDPDDVTLALPMLGRLSLFLPTTDSLTQCARSYSQFLAEQWFKRRASCGLLWLRITNGEDLSIHHGSIVDRNGGTAGSTPQNAAQPFSIYSLTEMLDQVWFKELGVPRAVQEALDFAYTMSSRAGQAIEALIPPACPKRRSSCTTESLQAVYGCPRRLVQEVMQHIDLLQSQSNDLSLAHPQFPQEEYTSPFFDVRCHHATDRRKRKHKKNNMPKALGSVLLDTAPKRST